MADVRTTFPAFSAVEAGHQVFCVVGADGSWSQAATNIALARIVQAGAVPIDTFAAPGCVYTRARAEKAP